LKIKWRLENVEEKAQPWTPPTGDVSLNVVGWIFQHVTGWYRKTTDWTWTPDALNPNYWEMWWVVCLDPHNYVAMPYKMNRPGYQDAQRTTLPASVAAEYYNDAFTIQDKDLRALTDGKHEIIYKKNGKVYFIPVTERESVTRWLNTSPEGNVKSAGDLHSNTMPPHPLPGHGLTRVAAISYQPAQQSPALGEVKKWEGLQWSTAPYYDKDKQQGIVRRCTDFL
jgi:hypothetical protein